MKRALYLIPLALSLLLLSSSAWADSQATPDEAKAMAIKAAEYLRSIGPEKAFDAFNAKDGPWHDRELYVAVIDSKGVEVAHGTNPGLIGKSVLELRDASGHAFIKEALALKEPGWVDYQWQNPVTGNLEPKTMYWIHAGEYIVGVGAYRR